MIYPYGVPEAMALLRRFLHCLRFFHQSITATAGMEDTDTWRVTWLGCSCGKTFYGEKPAALSNLGRGPNDQ